MTVHRQTPKANGLIIALAGMAMLGLQACETTGVPEPKYPIYMQDKPSDTAPAVAATETVVPSDEPVISAPPSNGGITVAELAPPPPPPPPVETASAAPVTAPVRDTRAAYVYTLVAQDTLYGVSRRFGVPVRTLYDINGFEPNAVLRIGQKVLLPDTAADKGAEARANGASMVRLSSALASAAPAPVATSSVPKLATSLPPPSLPKPAAPKPAPVMTTTTTTTTTVTKPTVTPPASTAVAVAKPPVTTPAAKPAAKPSVTTPQPAIAGFPTNAQLSQMGKGMFAWPVKGKLLVPFGQLAPNVRNDGINIASTSGTDVVAAADGVVVYQGDQVRELGNTIYVKHPNGWYTGYSHLSGMKVSNNQKVSKGQVIGTVGQTGTIDQPQLHFEVRYTPSTDIARPIDPRLVLP